MKLRTNDNGPLAGEYEGIKRDLIVAAGELFADKGVEGTSVRAIAKRCGGNIAAINYHFGSKENLYTEVLRYAMTETRCSVAQELLKDDTWFTAPAKKAAAVRMIVKEYFLQYFSTKRPSWLGRVLILSMVYPTASMEVATRQMKTPENEALMKVFQRCKPGLPTEQAQFFALSLVGQIAFYVLAKAGILAALGKTTYDEAFLNKAEKHIGDLILTSLGLPLTGTVS